MSVRPLLVADRAAMRTFWNNNRAGIAAAWPGGASLLSAADVVALFTQPGALNLGSFNGATMRGICASKSAIGQRLLPGETAEEIWLWLVSSGLSDVDHRVVIEEMLNGWWANLNSRGVTWGIGRNPPVYPARMETLFQKMIQAGMPVTVENGYRIVRMRPADAVAALGVLAGIP